MTGKKYILKIVFVRLPSSYVILVEKHRASNERSYINLRPLLGVSLLYPLALPSPLSSGSVIDRLQQLRPPTALSSFGDTLSVLIRTLIGRLVLGEWDQGQEHRSDNDFPKIFLCVFFFFCFSLPFFLPAFYSHLIFFLFLQRSQIIKS